MNGCSMNIGFYFFDKGLSGVDCSRPDLEIREWGELNIAFYF